MGGGIVSEQTPESNGRAPRVETAVALARVEAKLDVAIAQHGAQLVEHTRRIGAIEGIVERVVERVGGLEQRAAASDERDKRDDLNRTNGLSRSQTVALWLALILSSSVSIIGLVLAHR